MSYLKVAITATVSVDHDHFEIWRHTTSLALGIVHLVATRVGEDVRDRIFVDPGVTAGVSYWYWARSIDRWGNASAMTALGSATAVTLNSEMASARLLGRVTAGVGAVEQLDAAAVMALLGFVAPILDRNAPGTIGTTTPAAGKFTSLDVTGTMKFGAHEALGGESVTGYVTITDAGGTVRKLAVVS